ncbi:hypothetical protein DRO54_03915 [Candidatus Bathyarchaeota archaeon]|nr:MAG: hypothetical protein DRO54_03915 [Candidatus Bathyarchaeota archaeon]
MTRRTRAEVILNILTLASNGVTKTRLMYHCNMNYMHFNRYLKELLEAELIQELKTNSAEGIIRKYKTTEKGMQLVEILRKAKEYINI